jgi:hypothetical protein
MRRRFFRLRRIAVGLAFAALVAPAAASAYTGFETDGPATGVQQTDARHAALLNKQTVAPASPVSQQPTAIGQQAYAARLQAMADAYAKANGTPVRSENSYGAPGPSAGGATGPSTVQSASSKSSSGFDWNDAGIGAAVAFGIALLLVAAVAFGRRWHSRPQGAGLANA